MVIRASHYHEKSLWKTHKSLNLCVICSFCLYKETLAGTRKLLRGHGTGMELSWHNRVTHALDVWWWIILLLWPDLGDPPVSPLWPVMPYPLGVPSTCWRPDGSKSRQKRKPAESEHSEPSPGQRRHWTKMYCCVLPAVMDRLLCVCEQNKSSWHGCYFCNTSVIDKQN